MIESQLTELWAFSRGDTAGLDFEKWFLAQSDLEGPLGADLHWSLTAANYSDREEVRTLRKALASILAPYRQCECPTIRNLAAVPMEGNGLDQRLFATLEQVKVHGGDLWWLYLSRCKDCGQHWMIAQEERMFDAYFLRRLDASQADGIISAARWPSEFLTYERVLEIGRELSEPFRFVEFLDPALVWTVQDLREKRPDITIDQIADLLGVTPERAALLVCAQRKP